MHDSRGCELTKIGQISLKIVICRLFGGLRRGTIARPTHFVRLRKRWDLLQHLLSCGVSGHTDILMPSKLDVSVLVEVLRRRGTVPKECNTRQSRPPRGGAPRRTRV